MWVQDLGGGHRVFCLPVSKHTGRKWTEGYETFSDQLFLLLPGADESVLKAQEGSQTSYAISNYALKKSLIKQLKDVFF